MGFLGGNAVTVVDFLSKLQSQPDLANSRVIRLTHVKNLDSFLAHEYLQFILLTKKGRERVIVERTDPDQFVFNGQWKKPVFNTGIRLPDPFNLAGSDLPLPLILKGKHCYWYSLCIYQATKLAYVGDEKKWFPRDLRGSPTFLLPKDGTEYLELKKTALGYQEVRSTTLDSRRPAGPDVVKGTLEKVESIPPMVGNEEFQKEYLQEMQAPEESVPTSIIDDLDIPTTPRKEPSADRENIPDAVTFVREYDVIKQAMEKDSEAYKYVEIFCNARDARENEGRDPSEPIVRVTDADDFGYSGVVKDSFMLNWAMEAFIGKILNDIGVTPKVEA